MSAQSKTIGLTSPEKTHDLAQRFADLLGPGDVLLLSGDVGAGKTHFARGLIQSLLEFPEDVPSPTFTLVQTYEGRTGEIWHADLYRLTDVSEIEELGLVEAFTNAICLVEWPDRLGDLAPSDALSLSFEAGVDDDARILTLSSSGPRWRPLLKDPSDD